jgi:hypothetical protein
MDANMKKDSRTDMFQHAVLHALWIIILFLAGRDFAAKNNARNWISAARAFGDLYGVQGEKAKEYRREVTYCRFD